MVALVRVILVALVFQTVVYFSFWFYARARRREQLEAEWRQKDSAGSLEAFVKDGLEAYEGALKRRLIWGVYIVPTCALVVLVYLTSNA
jgi:hypothetical protein